ncbi:MAG: sulfotransferase domain-containing protein [Akkermansiaceae bacterium]|nr:sulfotransferase domain-containing protein [Verrucomicrobiales bacterium]
MPSDSKFPGFGERGLPMARGKTTTDWRNDFNLRRLMNMAIMKSSGTVIVSYPRSGRTWVGTMLHELSIDPLFSHAGAKKSRLDSPDSVCRDIPAYAKYRVLFLLRDPRDVIVSHYHHYVRKKKWEGDLPGFMRDPIYGFERLVAFNLGWLAAHNQFREFAVVRYEDLRQRTAIELARIVDFLRCKISGPQILSKVVAEQSFEQMKRREQSGELHAQYGKYFTSGSENDNQRMVRRGVVGSYLEEMAAAEREFCDDLLARYDYHATAERLVAQAA